MPDATLTAASPYIVARSSRVPLPDGTPLLLRPIVPDDKHHLVEGFRRLSPESRYRRFFSPMHELSPAMLAYLTEIDYRDHFAWIGFVVEDGMDTTVGVSRYIRLADPEAAEAAVTVIDPYQGRGIGSVLLEVLTLEALENGVVRFEGDVLAGNKPMREILARAGARFRLAEEGVMRFDLDLPRAGELKACPLYDVLRALARGEGDVDPAFPALVVPAASRGPKA